MGTGVEADLTDAGNKEKRLPFQQPRVEKTSKKTGGKGHRRVT